jgi:hypothetical protein
MANSSYKTIIKNNTLSEQNINFIVNNIIKNYRVGESSYNKCKQIISEHASKLIDELLNENVNVNESEIVDIIHDINIKCYNFFIDYLKKKANGKEIKREIHEPKNETVKQPTKYSRIISLDEKNELIKKQKPLNNLINNSTNPIFLQSLILLLTHEKKQQKRVYDKIININEFWELIKNGKSMNRTSSTMSEEPINNSTTEQIITKEDTLDVIEFDIDNLTKDDLPIVQSKLKELIKNQNNCDNEDERELIEKEIETIKNGVQKYKEKIDKELEDAKKKLTTDEKVYYLDLVVDPNNNFDQMRNIKLDVKTENKISEIMIESYFIPKNPNNITRFNNKFVIYINNKLYKIEIPTGIYTIDTIIAYIKNQLEFINIDINKDIITISNKLDMNFDLHIDEHDSIFKLLGFVDSSSKYRKKKLYEAKKPYNLNTCNEVIFILSGTSATEFKMEFGKDVKCNKIIKKSNDGFSLKQLVLNYYDANEQHYDFLEEFKTCLKITYL